MSTGPHDPQGPDAAASNGSFRGAVGAPHSIASPMIQPTPQLHRRSPLMADSRPSDGAGQKPRAPQSSAPGVEAVRSDAELLRATAAGDRDAFRTLVERYERRAFFAAYHLLGDEEESRDVVQEAFVRVYRSMDRFDERRSFYTWFYRIVTNLAIDHLRHTKHSRRLASEQMTENVVGGSTPSASAESDETRRFVRRVLDALPPKFKAVMVLRELHGLSCKEIATIVGSTHATIRWRMHRARILFREAWDRLGAGSGCANEESRTAPEAGPKTN